MDKATDPTRMSNPPENPLRPPGHTPYRSDIDGLRALAVLSVILFHGFPTIIKGGFIGVDIFFVISGYLISGFIFANVSNNTFSFKTFYSRRINRIFPALLLVLVCVFCLSWYFFIPDDFAKIAKHVVGSSTFLSNLVYLSESGYFDESAEFKPLLHLWSLAIEEQFYIVWPMVVMLAVWARLNILMLIFFSLLASFALNIYRIGYDTNLAFFSLQTRAWELLLGALLAFLTQTNIGSKRQAHLLHHCASLIGLGFIATGIWLIDKHSRFPGWWALLPTIGTALLIYAGPQALVNRGLLAITPLRVIGLISYPLYLWHWMLLSFATVQLGHPPDLLLTWSLIALSFGLAWGTYILLERPIRQRLNSPNTSIVLVLLMFCLGILGLHGHKHSGLMGQTQSPLLTNETGIYPCKVQFDKKQLCVFGNLDSQQILLIYGDSHAEHLTAALAQTFGARYKIIFAYTSSCYFNRHPDPRYQRPTACEPFITLVKELKGQNIAAAILSQRWHGYGIKEPEQIQAAVRSASSAFDLNPNKIIIVGSTADIDLRCVKHNYYFEHRRTPKSCAADQASIEINKAFMTTTSSQSDLKGVQFVYPYQKLCPLDDCQPIRNGILLYGDNHHLTRAGAALIMPEIKAIIDNP